MNDLLISYRPRTVYYIYILPHYVKLVNNIYVVIDIILYFFDGNMSRNSPLTARTVRKHLCQRYKGTPSLAGRSQLCI